MYRQYEPVNVEATLEVLAEVPTARLEWVCLEARKQNKTVSPPSDGKILDVWRTNKKNDNSEGWEKAVSQAMDRRLNNRDYVQKNGPYKVCAPGGNPRVVPGYELIIEAENCQV